MAYTAPTITKAEVRLALGDSYTEAEYSDTLLDQCIGLVDGDYSQAWSYVRKAGYDVAPANLPVTLPLILKNIFLDLISFEAVKAEQNINVESDASTVDRYRRAIEQLQAVSVGQIIIPQLTIIDVPVSSGANETPVFDGTNPLNWDITNLD